MNIRVLVADAISEEGLAPLQQNPGFSVQVKTGLKGADLLREVSGAS